MSAPASTPHRFWSPPVWLIVTCGCAIAMLSFGPRSVMGFFQVPMLDHTGWSYNHFWSGYGYSKPRLGHRPANFWSRGRSLWCMAHVGNRWPDLCVWSVSHGDSRCAHMVTSWGRRTCGSWRFGGSFGIILSVFARNVPAEKRSLVFGIGTAAGSAGMFLFAPISVAMIESFGWSHTLIILSAVMLLIPVLALPLYGNAKSAPNSGDLYEQTIPQALREAFGHRSYIC